MWHRLLVLLRLARPKPPEPDRTNVIDLGEERVRRRGVLFIGYKSQRCTSEKGEAEELLCAAALVLDCRIPLGPQHAEAIAELIGCDCELVDLDDGRLCSVGLSVNASFGIPTTPSNEEPNPRPVAFHTKVVHTLVRQRTN